MSSSPVIDLKVNKIPWMNICVFIIEVITLFCVRNVQEPGTLCTK
jgi:hypothetical protein